MTMIPNASSPKISLEELQRMVGDPTVKDSRLMPYLIIDERSKSSFQPRILPNPETVDLGRKATDRSLDFEATLIEIGIGIADIIY